MTRKLTPEEVKQMEANPELVHQLFADYLDKKSAAEEAEKYEESNKQLIEKLNNTPFEEIKDQFEKANNTLNYYEYAYLTVIKDFNNPQDWSEDLQNPSAPLKNRGLANLFLTINTPIKLNYLIMKCQKHDQNTEKLKPNDKNNIVQNYLYSSGLRLFDFTGLTFDSPAPISYGLINLNPAQIAVLKQINKIPLTKTDLKNLKEYQLALNSLKKASSKPSCLSNKDHVLILTKFKNYFEDDSTKYKEKFPDSSLESEIKSQFFSTLAEKYESKAKSANWKEKASSNELNKIIVQTTQELSSPKPQPAKTPISKSEKIKKQRN